MQETKFPRGVLPYCDQECESPITPDKRILQERNRTAVLTWLARFGWLTNRMISSLVWQDAAQATALARRMLKTLVEEKLVISRAMPKGGTAYLLAAKGSRLLKEQTGLAVESGKSLNLGNPVHRAASNWRLIQAIQQGYEVVTEHEIASGRGPCKVLRGKQADGLILAEGGACIWLECENSAKARAERNKTVLLAQDCLGRSEQVEVGPGLWLARVAIVATNEQALRWMAASFQDAHRKGLMRDAQLAEVDVCLLPISESLVPGEMVEGNMWWDILLPASL